MQLHILNDQQLIAQTKQLVQTERDVVTKILHHLREIDRRRLYCDFGCSSLFDYAVKELKYSEGQAGRRIQALRLIKELPEIEHKIQSGALSLSNVAKAQSFFREVARQESSQHGASSQPGATRADEGVLNKSAKLEILQRLENKSTRDGERELLKLQPAAAIPKEKERVLSDDLSEIKFVIDQDLKAKLAEVRSLLGPKGATMSLAELIAHMAEMSAACLNAKKFGKKRAAAAATQTPAPEVVAANETQVQKNIQNPAKGVRYIPQSIRHIVWHRDGKRCTQCGTPCNLNIDHKVPVACGGASDVENLRLLCFNCNQRAGIKVFGLEQMGAKHVVVRSNKSFNALNN